VRALPARIYPRVDLLPFQVLTSDPLLVHSTTVRNVLYAFDSGARDAFTWLAFPSTRIKESLGSPSFIELWVCQ
jgi:hypothetical protein